MSAFIEAMDAYPATQKVPGANGALQMALPPPGDLDGLVSLFVETVRDAPIEPLAAKFASAIASRDVDVVTLAITSLFQLRDVRGGKGERSLFTNLFTRLVKEYPTTACMLVPLIPMYGRYKDLVDLWTSIQPLAGHVDFDKFRTTLVQHYAEALRKDSLTLEHRKLGELTPDSATLSFAAKWLPGSKRSASSTPTPGHAFRRAVRDLLFPGDTHASQKLRLLVSACNKELNVVEALMSTGDWDTIDPSNMTSGALHKYRLAMLYECKQSNGELRGDDPKRVALRERTLAGARTGTINAGTLDAHQVVQKAMGANRGGMCYNFNVSPAERVVLDGQWKSILATVKTQMADFAAQLDSSETNTTSNLDLGNLVAIVDVSASMRGTPLEVAIALGLLLSELAAELFQHRVLTFHSHPEWHRTNQSSLYDKVVALSRARWGGSTNFMASFHLILSRLETAMKKTRKWIAPPGMITFSDMQFDAASGIACWNTTFETMEQEFFQMVHRVRLAGVEVPMDATMPPQIFWNLNSHTTGLVTNVHRKGVILLSGYNQNLLKLILKGQLPIQSDSSKPTVTPTEIFQTAMADTRYDSVRMVMGRSAEKVLAGYIFEMVDCEKGGGGSKGDEGSDLVGGSKGDEGSEEDEVLMVTE